MYPNFSSYFVPDHRLSAGDRRNIVVSAIRDMNPDKNVYSFMESFDNRSDYM